MGAPWDKRSEAVYTLRYLVRTQPGKYKGKYRIVRKVTYTIERK